MCESHAFHLNLGYICLFNGRIQLKSYGLLARVYLLYYCWTCNLNQMSTVDNMADNSGSSFTEHTITFIKKPFSIYLWFSDLLVCLSNFLRSVNSSCIPLLSSCEIMWCNNLWKTCYSRVLYSSYWRNFSTWFQRIVQAQFVQFFFIIKKMIYRFWCAAFSVQRYAYLSLENGQVFYSLFIYSMFTDIEDIFLKKK